MAGLASTVAAIIALSVAGDVSAPPVGPAYRVRPGDVLTIDVQDHPEFGLPRVAVPPDGFIDYPIAGRIQVVGCTLAEIKEAILRALRHELRNPIVTVNLVSVFPAFVHVYGEVNKPGDFDLIPLGLQEVSVSAAIGMAGGYSPNADTTYVTVIRKSEKVERIDMLPTNSPVGAPRSGEVLLHPGDTLIVPRLQETVAIAGEVNAPGRFRLDQDTTLLSLIAQAQGLTDDADRRVAILVHPDGSQQEIDISGIDDGTLDPSKLPTLHDGDVVVFIKARNDVVVLGEVNKPGAVPLRPRMTVVDAVAVAGGPTADADLERVEVITRDGTKRTVRIGTARGAIELEAQHSEQLQLSGGETIIVPEATHLVSVLGYVQNPGLLKYRPGERVLDVVARAGGTVEGKARPSRTLLIRPGSEGAQPQVVVCDLASITRGQKLDENLEVRDGDVIYVPGEYDPMSRKDWLRSLLQLGSALAVWQR